MDRWHKFLDGGCFKKIICLAPDPKVRMISKEHRVSQGKADLIWKNPGEIYLSIYHGIKPWLWTFSRWLLFFDIPFLYLTIRRRKSRETPSFFSAPFFLSIKTYPLFFPVFILPGEGWVLEKPWARLSRHGSSPEGRGERSLYPSGISSLGKSRVFSKHPAGAFQFGM